VSDDLSQTRSHNAAAPAAASTPKRTSGLGAVKKAKAGSRSPSSEQQCLPHVPAGGVVASEGVMPALHNCSTALSASFTPIHAADVHNGSEQTAAATKETNPVACSSVAPPASVTEQEGESRAFAASTQDLPAAATVSARCTANMNDPNAQNAAELSTAGAKSAEGGVNGSGASTRTNTDSGADLLKRRESQLEVRMARTLMHLPALSHAYSKVLATQLAASEQSRVRRC
jgi:hypothetical protein